MGYTIVLWGMAIYDDLPAQRLVDDDTSPAVRTRYTAIVNFSMTYVGRWGI